VTAKTLDRLGGNKKRAIFFKRCYYPIREFLLPVWKDNPMKIPAELKPAAWGAVGGAVALAVLGFSWGGWVTQSTAERTAKTRSETAVVAALSPICVVRFQQQNNATEQLVELKKISSWQQGDFIAKGGWATMPGSSSPDTDVAKACAAALGLPKS
jgi:pimeloyl-ACP methyl ester carboxylesterase